MNDKKPTTETEALIVICPVTNKDLFSLKDGKMLYTSEHGLCVACGVNYHVTALNIGAMHRSSWPVRYLGFSCLTCMPKRG